MNPSHLIYLLFLVELVLSGFWYTSTAITEVFLLVVIMMGCRALYMRHVWLVYDLSGIMLVYLAWLVFVAFGSHIPQTSIMTLATLANLPLIYLVVSNTPAFAESWRYFRLSLFVMGLIFAVWALWQVYAGYGDAVGPLKDRNFFAALMNILWFLTAFLFLNGESTRSRWKGVLFGGGLFIMSAALFATTSRGGIGTWLILLPILLWAAYRNEHSRRLAVMVPLIAMLAYFCSAQLLQLSVADRTFEFSQDPSISSRLLLWQSAIKMTLAHPLNGVGWGTFVNYYPAYRSPLENTSAGFFAHNDYLQMAAEGGVFALLLQLGILLGVLLQLRRSLKSAASEESLESVALLLGTLALFIHAAVNFIFYVAFMNTLAALYLARAGQLTGKSRIVKASWVAQIKMPLKLAVSGLLAVFIVLHLGPGLVAQAINSQASIKAANLESCDMNAYQIAKIITVIKPQERIAQEIVLQTSELALADSKFVSRVGADFQRKLLNETLERFDSVRAQNENEPGIGLRQANILIEHHAVIDGNAAQPGMAYAKAHQVFSENLKADPYHVGSIIMLARLYATEGRRAEALHILKQAEHLVAGDINQLLITVEILRQRAVPEIFPELDEIEGQLQQIKSATGIRPASPPPINDIQSRLDLIADRISRVR